MAPRVFHEKTVVFYGTDAVKGVVLTNDRGEERQVYHEDPSPGTQPFHYTWRIHRQSIQGWADELEWIDLLVPASSQWWFVQNYRRSSRGRGQGGLCTTEVLRWVDWEHLACFTRFFLAHSGIVCLMTSHKVSIIILGDFAYEMARLFVQAPTGAQQWAMDMLELRDERRPNVEVHREPMFYV